VPDSARADELRSARLLLGPDASAGAGGAEVLRSRAVRSAVRSRAYPSQPVRFLQRVERKLGWLDYERAVADPLDAARHAVLGARAAAPPRFLVRVDEYPHYLAWDDPDRYGSERFRRFHSIMSGAGVPYLVAVLPRVSHAPLDPAESSWRALAEDERAVLHALRDDGVSFGLHGLDHRTRFASPRRHSELCGLDPAATEALLDDALGELAALSIAPEIFVPPYNRFDADQYDLLARRFSVVCGGPESVGLLGFQRTPMWRGEAVYLPSYHPMYGHARVVEPAARALIERRVGLWVPVVLHWGWEADEQWTALERLLEAIAPHAARWQDFLSALAVSRGEGQAGAAPA
jgi:peptidoglycan/xylan/chitin deacetylase (PgdA/CDA1 family)